MLYFQWKTKILFQYKIDSTKSFIISKSSITPKTGNNNKVVHRKKYKFYQNSCILSYFFVKTALLTNFNNSFNFYNENQTDYKVDLEKKDIFSKLIFESLRNENFQVNLQKALDIISKMYFSDTKFKKTIKKCNKNRSNNGNKNRSNYGNNGTQGKKISKQRCIINAKSNYAHNLKNPLLSSIRMTLFEL